jgi:hypothetical protein
MCRRWKWPARLTTPRKACSLWCTPRADPKQADAYTREMVAELMQDLANVERGALVLFTSRAQMRVATEALPAALMEVVLVQGNPVACAPAGQPHGTGGVGLSIRHLRNAVVWRRTGPAGQAVRDRVHHQAAVCPAVRAGGRSPRRVAAQRGARPVQRTGDSGHRNQAAAMDRPRHPHRRRTMPPSFATTSACNCKVTVGACWRGCRREDERRWGNPP